MDLRLSSEVFSGPMVRVTCLANSGSSVAFLAISVAFNEILAMRAAATRMRSPSDSLSLLSLLHASSNCEVQDMSSYLKVVEMLQLSQFGRGV